MGKYEPLQQFLQELSNGELTLSFAEIESRLGFTLPPSAHTYREWWANSQTDAHPHAKAWLKAGWTVDNVDQIEKRIRFRRIKP
jgi:hypothetical protein